MLQNAVLSHFKCVQCSCQMCWSQRSSLSQNNPGVCALTPHPCDLLSPSWNKTPTEKITARSPHKVSTSHLNVKCIFFHPSLTAWRWIIRKKKCEGGGGVGWGSGARAIDSISMTTNTLKHNKPMLQVPIPFQGLKWPCRYLQITALHKAALSGAICQWPQGRGIKKEKKKQ